MNKKLRNSLIALAVIIGISVIVWIVVGYFHWSDLWFKPLFIIP